MVSEIGEQWSPHTAPARHAEMVTIRAPDWSYIYHKGQEYAEGAPGVPVAKDMPAATTNTIAGRNTVAALPLKTPLTNSPAPGDL